MKRIAPLGFAVSALALATACSGGYNVIAPSPGPSTAGNAGVVFLVTTPVSSSSNSLRKPNIAAPAGTQSVSVQLQSVNGAAVTGTPTTQNIAANANGCNTAGNQLVCQFTVNSAPGNDVFLVKMFGQPNAQGTATGAGNVSVNAAGGQNTTAPTVLSGTVASVAITAPDLPVGVKGSGNLVVVAKDAQGNTILGNYANAITFSMTDASGQTSLSGTNAASSTDAAKITLTYNGGAMSTAATIGASASGLSASAITPGKFLPDSSYPTVDGTTTYNVSYATANTAAPAPTPTYGDPQGTTETVKVQTGATFNGLTNLVAVSPTFAPDRAPSSGSFSAYVFGTPNTTYYQWTNAGTGSALQRVGAVANGVFPFGEDVSQTCDAPYQTVWMAPLSGGWDSLSGTGPCKANFSFNDGAGDAFGGNEIGNADGSFSFTFSLQGGPFSVTETEQANSDGTGTIIENNNAGGAGGPPSAILTIGTPAPNASTIPVTIQTFPGSIPNPMPSPSPTVVPTTIPNWYAAAGVPNGTVPSKLQQDTFTLTHASTTLPVSCNVDSSVVPAGTNVSNVTESFSELDPLSGYSTATTQWYVADGIGVVCEIQAGQDYYAAAISSLIPTFFSSGGGPDQISVYQTTYSLTPQVLQAAMARTRSFARAASTAQAQMLTYAGQLHAMQIKRLIQRAAAHHH